MLYKVKIQLQNYLQIILHSDLLRSSKSPVWEFSSNRWPWKDSIFFPNPRHATLSGSNSECIGLFSAVWATWVQSGGFCVVLPTHSHTDQQTDGSENKTFIGGGKNKKRGQDTGQPFGLFQLLWKIIICTFHWTVVIVMGSSPISTLISLTVTNATVVETHSWSQRSGVMPSNLWFQPWTGQLSLCSHSDVKLQNMSSVRLHTQPVILRPRHRPALFPAAGLSTSLAEPDDSPRCIH